MVIIHYCTIVYIYAAALGQTSHIATMCPTMRHGVLDSFQKWDTNGRATARQLSPGRPSPPFTRTQRYIA